MDYELNLEAQHRQAQLRRLAHKLASNRSTKRTVRKLPRAYAVQRPPLRPLTLIRTRLNTYKVGSYAFLMGLALGAFILDFNEETIMLIKSTVTDLASLPVHFLSRT